MKRSILLLEDDEILAETLQDLLAARGYNVIHLTDGLQALDVSYDRHFDLMILDVSVPGLDGFTLLEELRAAGEQTPVLFVTARTDIASLARGFKVGADDYLKKPFEFEELLIRIEALLKKSYHSRDDAILLGELLYRIEAGELWRNQTPLPLTPAQQRLLDLLVRRRNRLVSKEELLEILGEGQEASEGALRVHISSLRKLGLAIETRKGIGYRLEAS